MAVVLETDKLHTPQGRRKLHSELEKVGRRFRIGKARPDIEQRKHIILACESANSMVEVAHHQSSEIMLRTGELWPFFMLMSRSGYAEQVYLNGLPDDSATQLLLANAFAGLLINASVDAYYLAFEGWSAIYPIDNKGELDSPYHVQPRDRPDKQECVFVTTASRLNQSVTAFHIQRDAKKKVTGLLPGSIEGFGPGGSERRLSVYAYGPLQSNLFSIQTEAIPLKFVPARTDT